jgi:hypothetical protein
MLEVSTQMRLPAVDGLFGFVTVRRMSLCARHAFVRVMRHNCIVKSAHLARGAANTTRPAVLGGVGFNACLAAPLGENVAYTQSPFAFFVGSTVTCHDAAVG